MVVNFSSCEILNCCKTPPISVASNLFEDGDSDFFLNHPAVLESRENLLNNIEDKACIACWSVEKKNVQSSRQAWDGAELLKKFGITSSRSAPSDMPIKVEIILNTMCNLECIYCGPNKSSSWQKRLKKIIPENPNKQAFMERFFDWLSENVKRIEVLTISGGEPFLGRDLDGLVAVLVEKLKVKNTPTHVSIISNLYIEPEQFKKKINNLQQLGKVANVMIEFSNESCGAQAEYIRWGLQWEQFKTNLEFLMEKNPNFMFGAQITLNCLNVSSLSAYLNFLFDLSEKYNIVVFPIVNYVSGPSCLSPTILPPSFSQYLLSAMEVIRQRKEKHKSLLGDWDKYLSFIESMNQSILLANDYDLEESRSVRAEFKKYVDWLDATRGTKFLNTFPEYSEFYHSIPVAIL